MRVTKDRYIVEARANGNPTREQMQQMLRRLLAERFKVALRRETRNSRAYELVVEPRGHKMQRVVVDTYGSRVRGGGGRYSVDQITMGDWATFLQGFVGATVIDRTGLPDVYQFNIVYTPDAIRLKGVAPEPGPDGPGPNIDPNGPSLIDALREQLGLRLVETTAPTAHIVIEHAERPSQN
jgi:uncharacterized protein (TIGR03435 family)